MKDRDLKKLGHFLTDLLTVDFVMTPSNCSRGLITNTTKFYSSVLNLLQELTLEELDKAHMILRQHCQPLTGVSDGE